MSLKALKEPKILFSVIASYLLVAAALAIFYGSSAFADAVTDKATEYCSAQYHPPIASKVKNSCIAGYKRGYTKPKDSSGYCFRYAKARLSGKSSEEVKAHDIYKACANGKVKGKTQKKDDDKAKDSPASTAGKNDCAGVGTYFDLGCSGKDTKKGGSDNPIIALLLTVLSWITGLVALATVGGIVYGGILYTSAQDNTGQTQKGITYIVNSAIGLILWISAYALINFIVPGGLFAP